MVVLILQSIVLLRSYAFEDTCVTNIDYKKRVIESFSYNTSIYYAMYYQLMAYTHARENN